MYIERNGTNSANNSAVLTDKTSPPPQNPSVLMHTQAGFHDDINLKL